MKTFFENFDEILKLEILEFFSFVEINGSAPFSRSTEVSSLCPFLEANKIGVSFSLVTALISKFHVNMASTGFYKVSQPPKLLYLFDRVGGEMSIG